MRNPAGLTSGVPLPHSAGMFKLGRGLLRPVLCVKRILWRYVVEDIIYPAKLVLKNEAEFKIFLQRLKSEYGEGNIPLVDVCKFEFKWGLVSTM